MAIDFRCEKCGRLLNVEAKPGQPIHCHHCRARVVVPAALAALPTPQVPLSRPVAPPAVMAAEPVQPAPLPPHPEPLAGAVDEQASAAVLGVTAKIMPWVVSAICHLGIFMVLSFTVLIMQEKGEVPKMSSPLSKVSQNDPGGVLNPGQADPNLRAQQDQMQTVAEEWSQREGEQPLESLGNQDNQPRMIGRVGGGAAGGQLVSFGVTRGGQGAGPRGNFMGLGGGEDVAQVVYVIDNSGSMRVPLDNKYGYLKREILRSMYGLEPPQTFHMIFFADGPPLENTPRRLVAATRENKADASLFLREKVQAMSTGAGTDPQQALRRAFQVLRSQSAPGKSKFIYLLTDGEFVDSAGISATLRELNGKNEVKVFTFLVGDDERIGGDTLKKIASDNNGRYKFIPDPAADVPTP